MDAPILKSVELGGAYRPFPVYLTLRKEINLVVGCYEPPDASMSEGIIYAVFPQRYEKDAEVGSWK